MTSRARALAHPKLGRALLGLALAFGCARSIELGSDQLENQSGAGGSAGTSSGAAGEPNCELAFCRGALLLCGNCLDDDNDGSIDADDEECTGPCDNREDSLSTGLSGESAATCQQECYFDGGNGSGDDGCRFSHRCDPLAIGPDYPPTGQANCAYDETTKIPGGNESCADLQNAQDASCAEACGPLTPNGCDCFGCCELPAGSGSYIWLGSAAAQGGGCTAEKLNDPASCRPCTPVKSCFNDCKPCEVCVGRPAPLASCDPMTETACPAGYSACGQVAPGSCPPGAYCVTGCCIPEPR